MMLKTNKLRDAITFALVAGTTAVAGTGVAIAQEGQQATTLDRIQVTGSRIRQVDVETAQPVTFVTREEIQRQGFQSVADILQNISAVGAPPISRAAPLSSGENVGGSYISLRNLGAPRTLILLNGKRLGISTSGLQDIAAIPAAAIERIEVLKDGASSIYGSDAMAGVINIITRTNFEGAEANVYYGQYSEGDGAITNGDFTLGFSGDRGSLTVTGDWRKEDGVAGADRWFSQFSRTDRHPTDQWTAAGYIGGFTVNRTQAAGRFPNVTFPANAATQVRLVPIDPNGDLSNPANWRNQDTFTGSCPAGTGTPVDCLPGSTADKTNTNLQMDVHTPLETKSLFVDGSYDITDTVRFRTNLAYFNRTTDRLIAGYPMQAASFGTPMDADSYFNPIGTDIGTWWRRTWEVPRTTSSDFNQYRFSGTFEGYFEIGDRIFDWDVGYLHSQSKLTQASFGNLNLANVSRAVGPSFRNAQGQIVCGAPGAVDTGCVPWNPFVEYGVVAPGGMTGNDALQRFIFQEEHSTGETTTQVFSANLAGSIVTLPGGDLGFAVGVESRKEDGMFSPDALAQTGGSTNLAAGPTGGGYRVDEAYIELEAPLLSGLPFAEELTLTAATRFSDFDTFGETTNSKFGLRWKPFESLMLRATVADGFRAPTISDLYGGGSQTFAFYTDPCDTNFGSSANNATTRANCVAAMGALANTYRQIGQGGTPVASPNSQTSVAFTSGSNPTLTPELSKSQTIGFVWSPSFLEGFNASVDWWKIRIADTIVADSPTTILNDCYIQGITSRCSPQLFTRDAGQGFVDFMRFGSRNAGFRKAEGYDIDLTYRWDAGDYGNFTVNSNSTYTVYDALVSTNDPRKPLSSVGNTSSFRLRSNLGLSWQYGDFGASWTARYYSSMKEGCTYFNSSVMTPHLECNEITYAPTGIINADGSLASALSRRNKSGSTTFNDVQFRWQAPWNATIAVGANNVFEKYGPPMYSQPSANFSYYGGFDIGRFVYMKYQQRF
ncbi:TonB-dependent receptor [Luteimonas yindakuii]|uniref:TonB-dependent receptor n=1 Tax=Luteimonas yindakuii TaxID=2565782 RepID=A0A4Z1RIB4_9GAMM|nr:TonB-dependent receptor [Luteimonas yindakuii]QCO67196.2 TonB-dependent receptor [Luteimonas yindakuii]TKS53381.1 TonB-dependent receptor [Luteimonas yindakuii]